VQIEVRQIRAGNAVFAGPMELNACCWIRKSLCRAQTRWVAGPASAERCEDVKTLLTGYGMRFGLDWI